MSLKARAAFTVNSASVFKEDVDMAHTIVDDTLSYIPWGGEREKSAMVIKLCLSIEIAKAKDEKFFICDSI